nr:MAG TPA: hypothetical protein [Caudoviricetes sp.]
MLRQLASLGCSVRKLIKHSNVRTVVTRGDSDIKTYV